MTFKFIVQKTNHELIKPYVSLGLWNFPLCGPRTWVLTSKTFNNFLNYALVWNKTKYKNRIIKTNYYRHEKNMISDEENF